MPLKILNRTPVITNAFIIRFFRHVEVSENSCWMWTGHKNKQGYGRIMCSGRTLYRAHRISYLIRHGNLPSDKLILHTCDNPSCVNPDHLIAGTHKQNMQDCIRKGRRTARPLSSYHRGEKNVRSKLKANTVLRIVNLRSNGMQIDVIARRISHSYASVCDVLLGRTWSHLTGIQYKKRG